MSLFSNNNIISMCLVWIYRFILMTNYYVLEYAYEYFSFTEFIDKHISGTKLPILSIFNNESS